MDPTEKTLRLEMLNLAKVYAQNGNFIFAADTYETSLKYFMVYLEEGSSEFKKELENLFKNAREYLARLEGEKASNCYLFAEELLKERLGKAMDV